MARSGLDGQVIAFTASPIRNLNTGPQLSIARHREKLSHEFLVAEPVAEALDPTVGRLVAFGPAEPMAAGGIGVQLRGLVGGFPSQEERGTGGGYLTTTRRLHSPCNSAHPLQELRARREISSEEFLRRLDELRLEHGLVARSQMGSPIRRTD